MADTPAPVPLRIGVLGTANIARHFIAALADSTAVKVVAVASRDGAKAREFAARTGVSRALDSYEALLADAEIEAVYNPLPNTLHAEWSIRALEAGKHVLCEKPIAVTAGEARAMFAAARAHGLHLVEAFPYRAQPQTHAVIDRVRSGEFGRPRTIQACFGFPIANAANIRLDPALGGGALLDAGSYAVSLIRALAGEQPTTVSASAIWSDSGVDASLVANLQFPSGLLAQASCSFGTALHRRALIACETGVIQTDFLNHLTASDPGVLQISKGGWEMAHEAPTFAPQSGFLAEAESFAGLVRTGPTAWTGTTEAESIDIMIILEAILASARTGSAVTL